MAIKKQEFYEGAAIYLLARTGAVNAIRYAAPFFVLNDHLFVLLKYSTKPRGPWGFTFTKDEQQALSRRGAESKTFIALICGSDGVAAFSYEAYHAVATRRDAPVHLACYRGHGEHYKVRGPDGSLAGKVAPSHWLRILDG